MKQQQIITIQHCHCEQEPQFQIPVSYQPLSSKIQTQQHTLLQSSDEEQGIQSKFQKYNPNLKRYMKSTQNIVINDTKSQTKKKTKHEKQQINSHKETIKPIKQEIQYQQDKQTKFQFKKFDYIDRNSGCSCKKQRFTKFTWKPIFTSRYGSTIPEYRLDENGKYIPGARKQWVKQVPQPPIKKTDADTQTIKQPTKPTQPTKPPVSFGDISQVKPPKIKPPIVNIIPNQFDDSHHKPSPNIHPIDPTPYILPTKPTGNNHKIRYPQPSVFKSIHQGKKIYPEQQKASDPCDCQCHSKICKCTALKKKQLLSRASQNQYFAHQLISNGRSDICHCIISCCNCSCPLPPFQLPQYRLDPKNYGPLPANQMNEIPYAGKFRRYDFNGC